MLMRYLAFMGGRSGTEGRTVEQQVLEVGISILFSVPPLLCSVVLKCPVLCGIKMSPTNSSLFFSLCT